MIICLYYILKSSPRVSAGNYSYTLKGSFALSLVHVGHDDEHTRVIDLNWCRMEFVIIFAPSMMEKNLENTIWT